MRFIWLHNKNYIDWDALFTLTLSVILLICSAGLLLLPSIFYVYRIAFRTNDLITGDGDCLIFGNKPHNGVISTEYRQRLNKALVLYKQQSRTLILLGGFTTIGRLSEAKQGLEELKRLGLPETANVLLEESSLHTLENLRNARDLKPHQPILISNRYHLARCSIIAKSLNLPHRLCAAETQLTISISTLAKIIQEAFFIFWFNIGSNWALLTHNQRMLNRLNNILILLLINITYIPVIAADKTLWEFGIGLSGLMLPDYRGSDQYRYYALPFPYLIYRGKFFKSDRNGLRGTIFDNNWIEFNLSLGASLPVNSSKNRLRKNMPDLDPTIEIGPSINFKLWSNNNHNYRLDLRLPIRTAITVQNHFQNIGTTFSPHINLDIVNVADYPGWNLGMLLGPIFGSKRNHDYFYSVLPQYITSERFGYDAKAGYAGSQFTLALSKRYSQYWLGTFIRLDTLKSAVFLGSPLVEKDYSLAFGIGVVWVFSESDVSMDSPL